MAKHLDEIRGMQTTNYREDKLNTFPPKVNYVETKSTSTSTSKPKPKTNNSYKPSRSTKRGDTVGSGEYAVNSGDSLWKIAQAHGTTVAALKAANPEIKGNMIYPGQIINLGTNNTSTASNTPKTQSTESAGYEGTIFNNNTNRQQSSSQTSTNNTLSTQSVTNNTTRTVTNKRRSLNDIIKNLQPSTQSYVPNNYQGSNQRSSKTPNNIPTNQKAKVRKRRISLNDILNNLQSNSGRYYVPNNYTGRKS